MEIVIDVDSPAPVYEQIVRQIQDGAASGELPVGTPLPPVRQLAADLVLNRNTVARAYKQLEEQGVIQTAGRKGTFVRQGAAAEVGRVKTGNAERQIRRLVETLISDGLSRDEIARMALAALGLDQGRVLQP